VALLEVLAAVVIIGVAGLALIELVGEGTRAVVEARVREHELTDQDRLLTAYSLLRRTDLDQRLGRRDVGDYFVEVQRPERTLYRVSLGRRTAPQTEDLVTVVYRPEEP
jgi:hypothetical protein